jgi:hypothetical protein
MVYLVCPKCRCGVAVQVGYDMVKCPFIKTTFKIVEVEG